MKIYSVQDIKGKTFMNPTIYRNQVEATRSFETAVKDQQSQFNKFPEDFLLVEIGDWDMDTGKLLPYETIKSLVVASELM